MSKHIDFEKLEFAIEKSSPFTEICYSLIEESYSNLKYLTKLSKADEDKLRHYFKLIGGHYLSNNLSDDNSKKSAAITAYKEGKTAFEEFNKTSKLILTFDQAKSLGIGIVLLEEAYLEIDSIIINWLDWNETEQFENFSYVIQGIRQANYFIGQAMGSILQSRNLELDKSNGIHFKGGKVRAKIYEEKKKEAIRLYESGNYHTYISCGRKICDQLGVVPETIAKWLSDYCSKK